MSFFLPCLSGYTFFSEQFYISNNSSKVELFNNYTPFECKYKCSEIESCHGFNYNGLNLQCFILVVDSFSPSLLQKQDYQTSGFYMQSYDSCNDVNNNLYSPFYIIFIICISLFVCSCLWHLCCRNRRIYLYSRTNSSTALIETPSPTPSQIPPPYQATQEEN